MKTGDRRPINTMLPAERKTVFVVALIAMFRMFGLFALLPVLALYAAGLDGATPLLIGLAVGGYGLSQAALQIPFGSLSDALGRRPVILMGLALFAFGSILAGLSDTIYGVISGRFLQGAGAISATLSALLADRTRPEVRTRSMAIFGIGIGASFLLALMLGPVIAAAAGVQSLFWLAAVLAAVCAAMTILLPAASTASAGFRQRSGKRGIRQALSPELLRIDAYVFVLHTLMTAMFVALPFVLQDDIAMPLSAHWKIYLAALAASLLGTIPLVVSDEREGKDWVFSVAIALLVGGLLLLSFVSPSPMSVFAALAVFFAGFNFLEAGLPARLSIIAAADSRGAALGVFSSSQFLGAFAGGLLGGLLLAGDASRVFLACTGLAAGWLVLHLAGRPAA